MVSVVVVVDSVVVVVVAIDAASRSNCTSNVVVKASATVKRPNMALGRDSLNIENDNWQSPSGSYCA